MTHYLDECDHWYRNCGCVPRPRQPTPAELAKRERQREQSRRVHELQVARRRAALWAVASAMAIAPVYPFKNRGRLIKLRITKKERAAFRLHGETRERVMGAIELAERVRAYLKRKAAA